MSALVFLVLAALVVASALVVVLHPNPVHGACGLVSTLFLLSVFFVGLDAQLVAVLQVIVYAGAVVVLFLFVIMLLNLQAEAPATGGLASAPRSADGRPVASLPVRGGVPAARKEPPCRPASSDSLSPPRSP